MICKVFQGPLTAGIFLLVCCSCGLRAKAPRPTLRPERQRVPHSRSCDCRDPPRQATASPRLANVAAALGAGSCAGSFSPGAHRRAVRLARRIFDFHVSSREEQTLCGGDAERPQPAVWPAEILACRASKNLGRVGASATLSTDAGASVACTCHYCIMLEVASHGSAFGARLFLAC